MQEKHLINKYLILIVALMSAVLIHMLLRVLRLEKKVKWLSQRVALVNERTRNIS